MRIIYKRQHYLSVIRWGAVAVVQILNESVKTVSVCAGDVCADGFLFSSGTHHL
ncbi:conjugative transfer protein [Salmonella enterica subsp. enterica serovar Pullorum]|nr:conjugative transfer protein [Salmonella enterica subsp. enterica serovar Pullorum]